MKGNRKIQLLVFIPIIGGIALIASGAIASIPELMTAGIWVLFGGSFLIALLTTVVVVIKAVKDTSNDNNSSSDDGSIGSLSSDEREKEIEQLENINSTRGMDNTLATLEHTVSHMKKAGKASSSKAKVGGCLFVICFIACLIGGMVLLSLGYTVAGIIVFGCAFLIIIGSLVVVKLKEHRSMSKNYDIGGYVRKTGVVKSCSMSSSGSTGGRHTTRITSIVYRVQVEIDGELKTAYSREYYNDGEVIPLLVHKRLNIVKIVDGDDNELFSDTELASVDSDERKSIVDAHTEEFEKRVSERSLSEDAVSSEHRADNSGAAERLASALKAIATKREEESVIDPTPTTAESVEDKGETTSDPKHPSTRQPNPGYKGIKRK